MTDPQHPSKRPWRCLNTLLLVANTALFAQACTSNKRALDENEGRLDAPLVGQVASGGPWQATPEVQLRYPLSAATLAWVDEQKVAASDATTGDHFGAALSISGDTILVGAPLRDDAGSSSGAAYVLIRSAGTWQQEQKLVASDAATNHRFGSAVSVSGDIAFVGAPSYASSSSDPGRVYVFARNAGVWTEQQTLAASDGSGGDTFGNALSSTGDIAFVGAVFDDDEGDSSGSAYVFARSAGTWSETQKLHASAGRALHRFGMTVSITGESALVGAVSSAYIFARNAGVWAEEQPLTPSDGASATGFGLAVSLSGDRALVGAPAGSDLGQFSGSAYIFARSASAWSQETKLIASDGAKGDRFGSAVSLRGEVALVGAYANGADILTPGIFEGSAYAFERSAGAWAQNQKLMPTQGVRTGAFGGTVLLGANTALIGASYENFKARESGTVYVLAVGKSTGEPCALDTDCVGDHCANGYCCDAACEGACEACDMVGAEGACRPVRKGTTPAESCGGKLCDGVIGTCPESCEGAGDCLSGHFCKSARACLQKVVDGDACTEDEACFSAHCVDGVCCADACDSGCGSCALSGRSGVCTPMDAGHPGAPSCAPYLCLGSDTVCPNACATHRDCTLGFHCSGGRCRPAGNLGVSCDESAQCTSEHCTNGLCCDVDSCGNYRCGPAGVCETRCSFSAQCASGYQCNSAARCSLVEMPEDDAAQNGTCRLAQVGVSPQEGPRWLWALVLFGLGAARPGRRARASTLLRDGRSRHSCGPCRLGSAQCGNTGTATVATCEGGRGAAQSRAERETTMPSASA